MPRIKLTVTVMLARQEDGEVMETQELRDELVSELEGADPGTIGDYDVESWDVS